MYIRCNKIFHWSFLPFYKECITDQNNTQDLTVPDLTEKGSIRYNKEQK